MKGCVNNFFLSVHTFNGEVVSFFLFIKCQAALNGAGFICTHLKEIAEANCALGKDFLFRSVFFYSEVSYYGTDFDS